MSKPLRKSRRNWSVMLAILVTGLLGIGLWWGVYQYSLTQEATPKLIEALGTAGLSLAFGGVLGGVVKVLFDAWNDRRAARASELAFYDQLLMDFKSVYHTVESARFLIAAHQSAKTYGEQMREIPDAIITLHNVRRATRQGFPDLYEDLEGPIYYCIKFLKDLTTEYRMKYLRVSRLQSQDEAINKLRREEIAKGTEPKDLPRSSAAAWGEIRTFARLAPLLTATRDEGLDEREAEAAYRPYYKSFVRYIDLASYCLTLKLPNGARAKDAKMDRRRRACIRLMKTKRKRVPD